MSVALRNAGSLSFNLTLGASTAREVTDIPTTALKAVAVHTVVVITHESVV